MMARSKDDRARVAAAQARATAQTEQERAAAVARLRTDWIDPDALAKSWEGHVPLADGRGRRTIGDVRQAAAANAGACPDEESGLRAVALADEAYALGKAFSAAEHRAALAKAWGAWLDLMLSVSLPSAEGKCLLADVLDSDPALRRQFEAAFLAKPDDGS
jgi:hypothetical protein